MGNLGQKYKEIYLLRNEEVYKIFDFEQGRGFQLDFILFLRSKGKEKLKINDLKLETELYYQIHIEPKRDEFIGDVQTFSSGKEGWKEKFLEEISKRYGLDKVIKAENPNYRLIGLPFFNKNSDTDFKTEFEKIL